MQALFLGKFGSLDAPPFPRRRKGCGRSGGDDPRRPPAPSRPTGRLEVWKLGHQPRPSPRRGAPASRESPEPPARRLARPGQARPQDVPSRVQGVPTPCRGVGQRPTPLAPNPLFLSPFPLSPLCPLCSPCAPCGESSGSPAGGSRPLICPNLRNRRFPRRRASIEKGRVDGGDRPRRIARTLCVFAENGAPPPLKSAPASGGWRRAWSSNRDAPAGDRRAAHRRSADATPAGSRKRSPTAGTPRCPRDGAGCRRRPAA